MPYHKRNGAAKAFHRLEHLFGELFAFGCHRCHCELGGGLHSVSEVPAAELPKMEGMPPSTPFFPGSNCRHICSLIVNRMITAQSMQDARSMHTRYLRGWRAACHVTPGNNDRKGRN